jgi:hypothetical protein
MHEGGTAVIDGACGSAFNGPHAATRLPSALGGAA